MWNLLGTLCGQLGKAEGQPTTGKAFSKPRL